MAFNTTNGTAEEAWDEARYKAALAQLEALNDKVINKPQTNTKGTPN